MQVSWEYLCNGMIRQRELNCNDRLRCVDVVKVKCLWIEMKHSTELAVRKNQRGRRNRGVKGEKVLNRSGAWRYLFEDSLV